MLDRKRILRQWTNLNLNLRLSLLQYKWYNLVKIKKICQLAALPISLSPDCKTRTKIETFTGIPASNQLKVKTNRRNQMSKGKIMNQKMMRDTKLRTLVE